MAGNMGKKKPSLIRGVITAYFGLTLVLAGDIFTMILGAVLIGLGIVNVVNVINGGGKVGKEKASPNRPIVKVRKAAAQPSCPTSCAGEPRPAPRSRQEKELEQLESLYSAGLYDREEYVLKRRKILSGQ